MKKIQKTLIAVLAAFGVMFFSSVATATDPIEIVIKNPVAATDAEALITSIADYMLLIGAPLAVIMYVWAGFLFLTSGGVESKIKTARTAIIWTTVGLAVLILGRGLVEVVKELFI